MKRLILALVAVLLLASQCKKNNSDPCYGKTKPLASFVVKEIIGDTSFIADTIFRDNLVQFESLSQYDSVKWKLGNDPRVFTQSAFSLSFYNSLITIPIDFTGFKKPETNCFPTDNGIYAGTRYLTTVEQFDKAILKLSPLIGKYKGAYIDNPSDTFTVRIEYFDSAKYDPAVTGMKNFYWISNIPKDYRDTTSSVARRYAELSYGQEPNMGYKSLAFGTATFCYAGKAWLIGDSLHIIVGGGGCPKKKFAGKRL